MYIIMYNMYVNIYNCRWISAHATCWTLAT